jgi:putative membrane protein insertion efficiency factor
MFYRRVLTHLKPRTCRYYPTCSEYTYQAIQKFGVFKGLYYGMKRILRCNSFHDGGYDPLPKD